MSSERGHAVVTGSSSGIGLAITRALLQSGWQVTGIDKAPSALHESAFRAIALDLCEPGAPERAAQDAGRADALVHAAGVLRLGRLGALDAAAGALMWQVHVDAAARLANCLVPAMVERRSGRVVLISSRLARGAAGRSQYAATKAALVALARSWAAEVASAGVTVNVVSPAATQTAMASDPDRSAVPPRLPPIGRLIEPQEIASLVDYLLSPQAAAITGQDIQVCGGASLEPQV